MWTLMMAIWAFCLAFVATVIVYHMLRKAFAGYGRIYAHMRVRA